MYKSKRGHLLAYTMRAGFSAVGAPLALAQTTPPEEEKGRDVIVVTGSLNFSDNAADSNDENFLILADEGIAQLYLEEFERRWAEARLPNVDC